MNPSKEQLQEYAEDLIQFRRFLDDPDYNEDWEELGLSLENMLFEMLENWSTNNKTRLKWTNAATRDMGDMIFLFASDPATAITVEIHLDKDGISLQQGFTKPGNLALMPNIFWRQLLDLEDLGQINLIESETFGNREKRKYPYLFRKKSGSLFGLMRDLIAFPILYDREIEYPVPVIRWPFFEYTVSEVFTNGSKAFKILYQLNKRLNTLI